MTNTRITVLITINMTGCKLYYTKYIIIDCAIIIPAALIASNNNVLHNNNTCLYSGNNLIIIIIHYNIPVAMTAILELIKDFSTV